MKENIALLLITKKINADFDSYEAAAARFRVTVPGLENALKGKQAKIPNYLLEYAGLELENNYVKVKS